MAFTSASTGHDALTLDWASLAEVDTWYLLMKRSQAAWVLAVINSKLLHIFKPQFISCQMGREWEVIKLMKVLFMVITVFGTPLNSVPASLT